MQLNPKLKHQINIIMAQQYGQELTIDSVNQEQSDLEEKIKKLEQQKKEELAKLISQRKELDEKLEQVRKADRQPELEKLLNSISIFCEKYQIDKREVSMDIAISNSPPAFRRQLRTAKKEMLKTKAKGKSAATSNVHADISTNGRFNKEKAKDCADFMKDMNQDTQSPKDMKAKWGINESAYARFRAFISEDGFVKNVKQ